jgi:YjbE family integral membrane protein
VFDFDNISAFFRIILIDLVLSGDNAVVIGMAAARLPAESRRRAIILGGGAAVALRIIFTVIASVLLGIPLLQFLGGFMLLYIAFKLIQPAHESENITAADTLGQAIRTILMADVVMSLDNILAVAAAADHNTGLLLFGLALSIPLLLVGSAYVARLLHRFPILLYVGVLVLVHTAIHMINADDLVRDNIGHIGQIWEWILALVITGLLTLYMRSAWRAARTPGAHPST